MSLVSAINPWFESVISPSQPYDLMRLAPADHTPPQSRGSFHIGTAYRSAEGAVQLPLSMIDSPLGLSAEIDLQRGKLL